MNVPAVPDDPDRFHDAYADQALLDPWDQQDGETDRAYSAFLEYRDLPPGIRTAKRTVPLVYGSEYTVTGDKGFRGKVGQIQLWMSKYEWVERASCWDRRRADERAALIQEGLLGMQQRHTQVAEMAIHRSLEALMLMKPERIGAEALAKLIDVAVRVERQALGAIEAGTVRGTNRGETPTTRERVPIEGHDPAQHLVDVATILEEVQAAPEGFADATRRYLDAGGPAGPEADPVHPAQPEP